MDSGPAGVQNDSSELLHVLSLRRVVVILDPAEIPTEDHRIPDAAHYHFVFTYNSRPAVEAMVGIVPRPMLSAS